MVFMGNTLTFTAYSSGTCTVQDWQSFWVKPCGSFLKRTQCKSGRAGATTLLVNETWLSLTYLSASVIVLSQSPRDQKSQTQCEDWFMKEEREREQCKDGSKGSRERGREGKRFIQHFHVCLLHKLNHRSMKVDVLNLKGNKRSGKLTTDEKK